VSGRARGRFHPDHRFATVDEISPAWLRARGITALLVDADDTLVPGDNRPVSAAAVTWVENLKGAGIVVAILSNGTPGRVTALAERLGVIAFALSGKPFPRAFRRALRSIGRQPQETAMVGDQLFTDILGARWAGLHTILVTPLTRGRHAHTRAIRRLEAWALRERDGAPVEPH
jgi:HAD superfamily phosphatase (TIGR01668 family)